MSKRQSNTLFNYFKSPKVTKSDDQRKDVVGTPGKSKEAKGISDNSEAEIENASPNTPTTSKRKTPVSGRSALEVNKPTEATGKSKGAKGIFDNSGAEIENASPNTPTTSRKTAPVDARSAQEVNKPPEDEEEIIVPGKRSRANQICDSSDTDDENPRKKPNKETKTGRARNRLSSSSDDEVNESSAGTKSALVNEKARSKNNLKGPTFLKSNSDISDKTGSKSFGREPSKTVANRSPSTDSEEEHKSRSKKTLWDFTFQRSKSDNSDKTEPIPVRKLREIAAEVVDVNSNWLHNNLEFLKPNKIRDANRRKPEDPDYDPRTLYVPDNYLKDLTPAMKQWWELKSQHMDAVLFFKVGKFYELYHMDAVVGVMQLGFSYMRGEFAHSGFPESAYAKMAGALIEKGYKVARVEQTETPEMMNVRCKNLKKTTKFDKVVKREICQVSAKATCIYTAQMSEPLNSLPYYMYAICMEKTPLGNPVLGVCFVETSIGTFHLSQFDDDLHFSRLLALFAEYPAALILTERSGLIKGLNDVLNCHFRDIPKENLFSKTQFYTASDTLEKLATASYFRDGDGNFSWPELFKTVADDCVPKSTAKLSIRSLGACMWYLNNSKIDIQVLSMGKFEWYEPLDMITNEKKSNGQKSNMDYLILDSITVNNLNLLGAKGSLKSTLDRCETPFGKRLLQRWICRPLCHVEKIKERQKAVIELVNEPIMLNHARGVLKKMPDLERQLTKIHSYGNKFVATDHPDGRAIFYEAVTYSKRKIKDFLKTLRAFEKAQEIVKIFSVCEDRLLTKITHFSPVGVYVDLTDTLAFFKTAFDQDEAEREGKIIPKRGVVEEFDRVEISIKDINDELSDYLEEQSRFFGCKLNYFGSDKKRFQLEVPDEKCRKATDDYQLEGTKKGNKPAKRFSTPRTRELLAAMLKAEAERAKVILDLNRCIFEKFSEKHEQFDQVIQCLTILDVLCSLAEYARTYSMDLCVPDVLPFAEKPTLIIENGRFPCVVDPENFVPNNTKMGLDGKPSLLIITGPNMGGKSTLMRQVALLSIMAQMGSYIPASSCQLSLIDRVFTRLGAQDDIIHGQSTFYTELSEASSILKHATEHSLVLIDELGRGTSTHDGTAIATAYVKKLTKIKCRTTFSTHYHSLVDNFIEDENVQLVHMACMVENDEDPSQESVTFLYKMADGRCPKSYGFNAARLAGLNSEIISRARQVAHELENETRIRDLFGIIFTSKPTEIRELLFSDIFSRKIWSLEK